MCVASAAFIGIFSDGQHLAGSRDIAAVIDARIRHRLGVLVPLPARPWSQQVPALAQDLGQAQQQLALINGAPRNHDNKEQS